jgi:hypothetical protein
MTETHALNFWFHLVQTSIRSQSKLTIIGGIRKKILAFADIRVPESVLKGDGNAALEELGPGSAAVI